MSRPQSLQEVADDAVSGRKSFGHALDEFLDAFYLDHPNKPQQQRRLDEAPNFTGNPLQDAWLGAVGEHLARRWGLDVPTWTRRPQHYALNGPTFAPDSRPLRHILIAQSPAAFKSRMIFTLAEPLQRARFPRAADASCPPRSKPAYFF